MSKARRPARRERKAGISLAADLGATGSSGGWKLQDAKARFSELVRRARGEGPQRVTVRGRDAVVVVDADEFDRLLPREPRQPLVAFLEGLHAEGLDLDLERAPDRGRDPEL